MNENFLHVAENVDCAKMLFTGVKMWNELVGEILKYLVGADVFEWFCFMYQLTTQRTTVLCGQVLH